MRTEIRIKTRNVKWKKIKEWNFLYSSHSRMRNRSFPSIKNLYRFLFQINTLTNPPYIASLWWDSRKKKSLTSAWVFSCEFQTVREQIFGNLNEDVPKVLSAALVPHVSVKFIGCTRRAFAAIIIFLLNILSYVSHHD